QNAVEILERTSDSQALAVDPKLTDRPFVASPSPLDDRYGLSDRAKRFEVPQQEDRVGQIGGINRRLHGADQAMLSYDHNRDNSPMPKIRQEIVELNREEPLLG